jgi:hypothetical protein
MNTRLLIGERTLQRTDVDSTVTVKVFSPERDELGGFRCYYQICGIGNEALRFAGGIDALQSIQIAFEKIGADLYLRHRGIEFRFGDIDDPGFPEPVIQE